MVGTVVVGSDATGPSRAAVDWALARAASIGLDVELVHVVNAQSSGQHADREADSRDREVRQLDTELSRARAARSELAISGRIVRGVPLKALVDASAGASLLVIGTHKTGFTYGRAFGSKFLPLVSLASCAVAVIPEMLGRSRRGIVVGAGAFDVGMRAVEFAAAEAVRTNQPLLVVGAWGEWQQADGERDSRVALVANAASAAHSFDDRVIVRSQISHSPMAEALIAASSAASMLVLARPGSDPDDPSLAVTHDVLANISSPVVVIGARSQSFL